MPDENAGTEGTGGDNSGGTGAATFSQEQVNSFVAEERRKADEKIAKIEKEANEKGALATQADERIKEIEKNLSAKEHEALKYRVALDSGLPRTVAERLQGDDEAALKKDAEELSELLKKPDAEGGTGRMAGAGAGPPEEGESMNDLIRKKAGRG
jgi:(p)ppGpp synthase/HD superfamily hydrolase